MPPPEIPASFDSSGPECTVNGKKPIPKTGREPTLSPHISNPERTFIVPEKTVQSRSGERSDFKPGQSCNHRPSDKETVSGGRLDTPASNVSNHARTRSLHGWRKAAGKLLKRERVHTCGQKAIGPVVQVHHVDGRAHFSGVETCGSVWHCPLCAVKITEGRREEIDEFLAAHESHDGAVYMLTVTVPHHRFQKAVDLRKGVAAAWRRVQGGGAWKKAKDRGRVAGTIRALEVTHGQNGWHPHLHILVAFEPGAETGEMEGFCETVFVRWAGAVAKEGFGKCSRKAFAMDRVNATTGAADYVSKWGAGHELTKAHVKQAGRGGRTPWQLLRDYAENGDKWAGVLFQEYAIAFKGSRQLTWSGQFFRENGERVPDLRKRYTTKLADLTDEDLAQNEEGIGPDTHSYSLDRQLFNEIGRRGLTGEVLNISEQMGLPGVLGVLEREQLQYQLDVLSGDTADGHTAVPFVYAGSSP